ncbi:ABC transporter permease [Chloroflexota bacterium]
MGQYLVRRLLQSIIVIFGVTLISFFSLHLAGDPTYMYVSERATAEQIELTRHNLGFDRPLVVQYGDYVTDLVRGDFGNSLSAGTSAMGLVMERMPATIELTLFAMFIATFFSIPIGLLAATKRGTAYDGGIMLIAIFGQSMPAFWLGLMLMLYPGLNWGWFPISGYVPVLKPMFAGEWQTVITNLPDALRHLILPGITIGMFSLSRNARLIRSSMLEVLALDYVRTARAKGLHERVVIVRHAFRNALIPFVTILGLEFGFLLSGVVVVETVFSWPGVGRLVFYAINQRDIPVVQATVVLFSLMFVGLNLLVDLLYARLDPRIRLH